MFIATTTGTELHYEHVFEKKTGPDGKVRRNLAALVQAHREALLEEWEAHVHDDEDN